VAVTPQFAAQFEEKRLRKLEILVEKWPWKRPLSIAGHVFSESMVVVARIVEGPHEGLGEALGMFYRQDTAAQLALEIETMREPIESGIDRTRLRTLLRPGGARNALDCALWDLESKRARTPVWELAGLPCPKPVLTTFTIGADAPSIMAKIAAETYRDAKAIKLKLLGDGFDVDRVRHVREARPDVWLGVDANQSLTGDALSEMLPALKGARVAMIEQPCKVGQESDALLRLPRDIPIVADESIETLSDIEKALPYYDMINIKLDKCGGLTEALLMARSAQQLGLGVMVGNMGGTSLSIAPALILASFCKIVDLDAPIFLARDRTPSALFCDGLIEMPDGLWGK
jgi:L-alanine-DL-glutamate epimerase-like enolase superfamily enzyme